MKKLVLDVQFQSDFLDSLKNNGIKNWFIINHILLYECSELLKKVTIVSRNNKKKRLCIYIRDSVFLLFYSLCQPEVIKLSKNDHVKKFQLRLLESNRTKKWDNFYKKYDCFFAKVLGAARDQNILDIRIEGTDKKQYISFHDARNLENERKSTDQVACDFQIKRNSAHKDNNGNRYPNNTTSDAPYSSESSKNESGGKTQEKDVEEYKEQINRIASLPEQTDSNEYKDHKEQHTTISRHSRNSSISSFDWSNRRNKLDESFARKLNAQNEKFAEELREMREKRERLNREAEEEMRRFKEESRKRILFFLNCIQLRIRWEEQEEEWGDWLKSVRAPVVKVKQQFIYFGVNRQNNDEEENRSEVIYLHKYVQNAYYKLVNDFESLTMLSHKYEDKLFLKVMQKKISLVATKLCVLMEELDQFQNDAISYSRIKILEAGIDVIEIPTTEKLRRICKTASTDEFEIVPSPKKPKQYCVITEVL